MDPRRFDSLARSLAVSKTRRGLFGSVAALAAGALGLRAAGAQVSQRQCGNVVCASNPAGCAPGCVCCVYSNGNSRCRPPGQCSPGQAACPADRPFVDPARGCVQCLNANQCPAPAGECTFAACVDGVCISTEGEDGAACPGGVCVGGVCCDSGIGVPRGGEECDALNGGICCSGATKCCGGAGCCTDCFIEDTSSTLCCDELSLCPPRSESNPEPPYCCRSGEICAADESAAGARCYLPERVCNGRYCRGECCGGTTCCLEGTYCSGGSCVAVPQNQCLVDEDCGPLLKCVGVARALITPDGGGEPTVETFPGSCCPVAQNCDSELEPDDLNLPNAICCGAGQRCNNPFQCCELEGCSPRGGRTRL